jgi:hypothetical protein
LTDYSGRRLYLALDMTNGDLLIRVKLPLQQYACTIPANKARPGKKREPMTSAVNTRDFDRYADRDPVTATRFHWLLWCLLSHSRNYTLRAKEVGHVN